MTEHDEPLFYPDFYERGVATIDSPENDTMPVIGNRAYYAYLTDVLTAVNPDKPIAWSQIEMAIILDRTLREDEARRSRASGTGPAA